MRTARSDTFTEVMRSLPSGVCVVTAFRDGEPAGMTASSITPLSYDPMLVGLTIRPGSQTLVTASAAGRFGVNVLSAPHAALALQFASGQSGEAKYLGIPHRLEAGAPVLDQARAWLVCNLHCAKPIGDHALLVGAVEAVHHGSPSDAPLVTHLGRLTALAA